MGPPCDQCIFGGMCPRSPYRAGDNHSVLSPARLFRRPLRSAGCHQRDKASRVKMVTQVSSVGRWDKQQGAGTRKGSGCLEGKSYKSEHSKSAISVPVTGDCISQSLLPSWRDRGQALPHILGAVSPGDTASPWEAAWPRSQHRCHPQGGKGFVNAHLEISAPSTEARAPPGLWAGTQNPLGEP